MTLFSRGQESRKEESHSLQTFFCWFLWSEMPRSSYQMIFWKKKSLQFRPSVIRGPWVMLQSTLNTCLRMQKINISTFLVVRYFKTTLISFMLMLICNFFNCATFWPDIDLIRSVNTFLQTFVIFFYLLDSTTWGMLLWILICI